MNPPPWSRARCKNALLEASLATEKKGKLSHWQRVTDKMEREELTNVLEDVDDKERSDQVVDALHVAAGWMADGPDE